MGLLFVGVLAGILIGFGLSAPSQGYFIGCASQPCFGEAAGGRPLEPKPVVLGSGPAPTKANPATPTKSTTSSSTTKRTPVALANVALPRAKAGASAAGQPGEIPDAVLNKARASIAAKMDNHESVELSDMKRAIRKNTLGRPVDTICGRVKGESASGGGPGERPFLYLVKEDDAYVVDGKPESAASIAYRNICN